MINKTSELRFIRLVNPVVDPAEPTAFELVDRSGRIIPIELAWNDLPRVAHWLGFGAEDEITARLENLEHWTGAILDVDPAMDWSVEGDKPND